MLRFFQQPARLSSAAGYVFPLLSVALLGSVLMGRVFAGGILLTAVLILAGLVAHSKGGATFAGIGTLTVAVGSMGVTGIILISVLLGVHQNEGTASVMLSVAITTLTLGSILTVAGLHPAIGTSEFYSAMVGLLYLVVPLDIVAVSVFALETNLLAALIEFFKTILFFYWYALLFILLLLALIIWKDRQVLNSIKRVSWIRYQRRVIGIAAGFCVPIGLAFVAPVLIDVVRRTPELHYSVIPQDGFVFIIKKSGIYITEINLSEVDFLLIRSSEEFLLAFDRAVAQFGDAALTILLFSLSLTATLIVLGSCWLTSSALNHSADAFYIGLGVIFIGILAGGSVGVPTLLSLGCTGLVFFSWDLVLNADSIESQLGKNAGTLRGELIHGTGTTLVVASGLGLATIGRYVSASVPSPTTSGQELLTLVLAASALVLSLSLILLRNN